MLFLHYSNATIRILSFIPARLSRSINLKLVAADNMISFRISFIIVSFCFFLCQRTRERILGFTSSYDTLRRSFRINCAIYLFILSTEPLSRHSRQYFFQTATIKKKSSEQREHASVKKDRDLCEINFTIGSQIQLHAAAS